jgi:hypothetical protein
MFNPDDYCLNFDKPKPLSALVCSRLEFASRMKPKGLLGSQITMQADGNMQ